MGAFDWGMEQAQKHSGGGDDMGIMSWLGPVLGFGGNIIGQMTRPDPYRPPPQAPIDPKYLQHEAGYGSGQFLADQGAEAGQDRRVRLEDQIAQQQAFQLAARQAQGDVADRLMGLGSIARQEGEMAREGARQAASSMAASTPGGFNPAAYRAAMNAGAAAEHQFARENPLAVAKAEAMGAQAAGNIYGQQRQQDLAGLGFYGGLESQRQQGELGLGGLQLGYDKTGLMDKYQAAKQRQLEGQNRALAIQQGNPFAGDEEVVDERKKKSQEEQKKLEQQYGGYGYGYGDYDAAADG